MQNVTQFVNDKDEGLRLGATSLDVRFEYYAEHLPDDEDQQSDSYACPFEAVDAARRLKEETGRQTQVRVSLDVDGEERYIEQDCLAP